MIHFSEINNGEPGVHRRSTEGAQRVPGSPPGAATGAQPGPNQAGAEMGGAVGRVQHVRPQPVDVPWDARRREHRYEIIIEGRGLQW